MLRPIVALCLLVAASTGWADSGEIAGVWTAVVAEKHPDQLQFFLQTGNHDQNGFRFDRSALTGLTAAQVASEKRSPVQFELRREAGTIAFDGAFHNERGAGDFTFTPNRDFPKSLRAMGLEFEPKHGDEDRELLNLTMFDVSVAFIRSMQAIGYRVDLEKYVAFRIFDVNPAYVREMAAVGFDHLSADKLVETRIHGATPEYIREMRSHGEDLTLDKYIESRIFEVTPEFAQEMSRAGYSNLDRDMLVQFRIHGVTVPFIRELRELGYSHIPAQKLVEMRIHGVTPEFIRRVAKAGYHNVPIDKLVQMRIFDIDPEMVKALDDGDRR
jgi:predicted metallopeptidase